MKTDWLMFQTWERARLLARSMVLILGSVSGVPSAATESVDFTFRRVGPPEAGTKRLIDVQVSIGSDAKPVLPDAAPKERLEGLGALGPLGPVQRPLPFGEAQVARFWSAVPMEPGPGRLVRAAALAGDFDDRAGLRRLGLRFGALVKEATQGTAISSALVLAVIMIESAGRVDAVSHAGAAGLMQLMPQTAERFGVQDRFDPGENLRGGVMYLSWLLEEFGGDALLALAGYNAGENAVRRHGGVPPYPETRSYVPRVLAAWRVAAQLCETPQVTAADKCELRRYALAQP